MALTAIAAPVTLGDVVGVVVGDIVGVADGATVAGATVGRVGWLVTCEVVKATKLASNTSLNNLACIGFEPIIA